MKNFKWMYICFFLFIFGCSNQYSTNPASELPTPYVEVPDNQFLFVVVSGNDYCPNECDECYVTEQPAPLYAFKGDKLFFYNEFGLVNGEDWKTFRANNDLVGLSYSSKEWSIAEKWTWDADLFEPIKTLPFDALLDLFVIHQINQNGSIDLILDDKFIKLRPNEYVTISVTRQDQGLSCPVTHEYTMTNYGFINDDNVVILNDGTAVP